MNFGPPPSSLCLVSELPCKQVGDKVRFLGCVISYTSDSGTLKLEHKYPKDGPSVCVLVNVDHVLPRLGPQETRVGEWMNIIGYITSIRPSTGRRKPPEHGGPMVHVQALIAWSAGSLDVQQYETRLTPKPDSNGGDGLPR